MADKLCSLQIENKKGKTRAIARSVIGPNTGGLVHFYTLDQVSHAKKLEENQEIDIKSDIPSFIEEQLEAKKSIEEEFPVQPVSQVRSAFASATSPVSTKNEPEGWNSPNQAYRGTDLSDRDSGFASTSSKATQEASETFKKTGEGEETRATSQDDQSASSAWNSPDDAYAGEDLKDRQAAGDAKGQEAKKFEERKEVGPQEQSDNDVSALKQAASKKKDDSKSEEVQSFSEKPEWYLTYEEVEGKNKSQLQEWSEKEVPDDQNFTLSKSKNAKETKEEVHNFLSNKFDDHAE